MKHAIATGLLATAVLATASYPPYIKKHLYATHDLRGLKAPAVEAATWLSGAAPETKGRTVLVDLWATWCRSCRELIPELNQWSAKFKGDLVVVGISDEDASVVRKFMAGQPMKYNVGVDPKQHLESLLGVEGIPHVLVISPDGIVRWQGFPGSQEDPLTTEKLTAIIQEGTSTKR